MCVSCLLPLLVWFACCLCSCFWCVVYGFSFIVGGCCLWCMCGLCVLCVLFFVLLFLLALLAVCWIMSFPLFCWRACLVIFVNSDLLVMRVCLIVFVFGCCV